MTLSLRLFLRSLAAVPFRLMLTYAGLVGLLHLDVKPLPLWTLDVLTYLLQFATTYLLAWWVMRRRATSWKHALIVFATFLVFGIVLETGLALALTGPQPGLFLQLVSPGNLILYAVSAVSVAVAFFQVRPRGHVMMDDVL